MKKESAKETNLHALYPRNNSKLTRKNAQSREKKKVIQIQQFNFADTRKLRVGNLRAPQLAAQFFFTPREKKKKISTERKTSNERKIAKPKISTLQSIKKFGTGKAY